jgi:hypothetical protein
MHNGCRIGSIAVAQSPICCALCVGPLIWFGVGDGRLVAYDIETHDRVASFSAHASTVIALVQAGMFLYSLGADGSISGWNAVVRPVCALRESSADVTEAWDKEWRRIAERWCQKLPESVKTLPLAVRVCTWNANDLRPKSQSVFTLVAGDLDG